MLTIEELSQENAATIATLAFKLWPEELYQELLEYYQESIGKSKETAFLIKEENQGLGFIQVSLRTDYVEGTTTSPVCYIEGIYVEPDYRRIGIARQLVQQAERWGFAQGCSEIASDVEIENEQSILFHEEVGFEEANRVVCYSKPITFKA